MNCKVCEISVDGKWICEKCSKGKTPVDLMLLIAKDYIKTDVEKKE